LPLDQQQQPDEKGRKKRVEKKSTPILSGIKRHGNPHRASAEKTVAIKQIRYSARQNQQQKVVSKHS
jgi:hypothetical protein